MGYYQLLGLLFSITCSPEKIQTSEWFDLIWLNDDPHFDNESDAREFYHAIVGLHKRVDEMAVHQQYLPFSEAYCEQWQHELADWCDGMLMGHQYLEDVWVLALDDINDPALIKNVDASLCLASTFSDLVRAKQVSLEYGVILSDEMLPEAYSLFRKVLAAYADAGQMYSRLSSTVDSYYAFDLMKPVARHMPCPCGSGNSFGQCCLH